MKIRHIVLALFAGFIALVMLGLGLVAFEAKTHGLSTHFKAKEARLRALMMPLLEQAFENPKLLDVTGPISDRVRTSLSRRSSPFGDTAEYGYAVRGSKSEATLEVKLDLQGGKWVVLEYKVTPAATPLPPATWTDNPKWDAEDWEELEGPEMLEPPDPPDAPSRDDDSTSATTRVNP